MKTKIVCLMASLCLSSFNSYAKDDSNSLQFPSSYEEWVRERVGPVVYPAPENDPGRGWNEFLKLFGESKFQAVKTWLGTQDPGELIQKLKQPAYVELCDNYSVVHLNICSGYLSKGYANGKIDPQTLKSIENDWYDCASYLYKKYQNRDKTFLFSACAELNAYMGTEGRNADLPVSQYVNTCHKGVERARQEFGSQSKTKIYSVAEVQCEVEYNDFIKKFIPSMTTDLYSLSHYCFHKDFKQTLELLGKYAPPSNIFGKKNLMVGEFGPPIENCNYDETARIRYYDTLLQTSYRMGVQFAFFYSFADTKGVINAAGHDGLVGWNDKSVFRRPLWDYFYAIGTGGKAIVPTKEIRFPIPWIDESSADACNLIVTDIKMEPAKPKAGDAVIIYATVKNTGKKDSKNPCINVFVDDYIASWACFSGPFKSGESGTVSSINQDKQFVWRATSGTHTITVLVDPHNAMNESSKKDNDKSIKILIP